MSDFSFDRLPFRRDPSPELSGGSFTPSRPVDDALLSTVAALSAPNPRFETLVGVVHGMGLSAPTPQLGELWRWLTTSPHHREVVQFPSDRDLSDLAEQLDARITLFREADDSKVGYTFQIQPLNSDFAGMVFAFRRQTDVIAPSARSDSSELSIHPHPSIGHDSQIAALREALRLLGVTRAAQVEREGSLNFGRPSADTGLDRINFMRQVNFSLTDLGEKYRIGRMTKCIVCEGVGKGDFEYILKSGNQEFQRETLRRLWDEWMVARPHAVDRALVMTDRELRSAARQIGGLVGMYREVAPGEGVTYGFHTVLKDGFLAGMRVVATSPARPDSLDGLVGEESSPRVLLRILGAPGILAASRAQMMARIMPRVAPEFRPSPDERLPSVIDLGRSPILCSRNIRLFIDQNA